MAEAVMLKCPSCGRENDQATKKCDSVDCRFYLKSDLECLRSIDLSLRTIKRIAILWLVLTVVGIVVFYVLAQVR